MAEDHIESKYGETQARLIAQRRGLTVTNVASCVTNIQSGEKVAVFVVHVAQEHEEAKDKGFIMTGHDGETYDPTFFWQHVARYDDEQ